MEKFTIIDGMKARIKELTAELAQLEKALAALQPEAKPKEPKSARLPRDPGAPKLGRPKKYTSNGQTSIPGSEPREVADA